MNHDDLSKLPPQTDEYEVDQSKQCLFDQGINPKFLEIYHWKIGEVKFMREHKSIRSYTRRSKVKDS